MRCGSTIVMQIVIRRVSLALDDASVRERSIQTLLSEHSWPTTEKQ